MYYITEIFLLVVGKFRSLQAVSYSLWIISGRFLLVLGRFRSFQVVSCSLQVVSGSFLLVVGRFRSFQVAPRFSKYHFVCQFPGKLPNNSTKRILGHQEILRESQFVWGDSIGISLPSGNKFGNSERKSQKCNFPLLVQFCTDFYFRPYILFRIVVFSLLNFLCF